MFQLLKQNLKIESVEMISVYRQEGYGKTYARLNDNDTMPYTYIV